MAGLRQLHGYNEHAYVLDQSESKVWNDRNVGAVCYVVARECLASYGRTTCVGTGPE